VVAILAARRCLLHRRKRAQEERRAGRDFGACLDVSEQGRSPAGQPARVTTPSRRSRLGHAEEAGRPAPILWDGASRCAIG
jgi:hypothetical protein